MVLKGSLVGNQNYRLQAAKRLLEGQRIYRRDEGCYYIPTEFNSDQRRGAIIVKLNKMNGVSIEDVSVAKNMDDLSRQLFTKGEAWRWSEQEE